MSIAAAITQQPKVAAPDLSVHEQLRPLCPGRLRCCSTYSKQHLHGRIFLRSSGHLSGGPGRSLIGSRVLGAGVLARDGVASGGTTASAVVGSELIVLGLSPVAPVVTSATDGAPELPRTPLPQVQAAGDNLAAATGSTRQTLLGVEETLAAEDVVHRRPTELHGDLRNVALNVNLTEAVPVQVLSDSAACSTVCSSPFAFRSVAAVGGAAASVYVVTQAASSASGTGAAGGAALNGSQLNPSQGEANEQVDTAAAMAEQRGTQQELQETPRLQGLWQRFTAAVRSVQWPKLWALALLFVSYVHQATTGFALPAMLPMISNELHLTDLQGALLTTGYSYLYAVALVPIGLLADRVSRPRLLAAGLAVWSVLTCVASGCRTFGELILARVGFAAAQGAQNPVCFSLIPELFPVNKSTALSLYNCAIYVGRALSFAAVLLARHLHDNDQAHLAARGGHRLETRLDHLDRADLHSLAIMHTAGEMAAATPDREFNFPLWEYGNDLPDAAWRQVLRWIAVPGFLIGLAMMATLQEPRQPAVQHQQQPAAVVAATPSAAAAAGATPAALAAPPLSAAPPSGAAAAEPGAHAGETAKQLEGASAATATAPATATATATEGASAGDIWALLCSPGFMSVTLAAALNDVGSYALIAWQSTFYERVYGLESSSYAPVLAALLPIGGILGGVGGGYLADRLTRSGRRAWVTAGATMAAAPCLAASCLAASPELSYAALVVGFALSEAWRAPSAVMARGIAPAAMGSTASALYLCVRNLVGGLGPLMVAGLIGWYGLQTAMLVVPAMYLASGLIFAKAETLYDNEVAAKTKAGLL